MAFDPYYKWLGIPSAEQPAHYYRLLGISVFEPDAEVIDSAANRQMAYVQGAATGEYAALSQSLLNELAAARLCLLDPAKKAAYDKKLRAELAAQGGAASSGASSPAGDTEQALPWLTESETTAAVPSKPRKSKPSASPEARKPKGNAPAAATPTGDRNPLPIALGAIGLVCVIAVVLAYTLMGTKSPPPTGAVAQAKIDPIEHVENRSNSAPESGESKSNARDESKEAPNESRVEPADQPSGEPTAKSSDDDKAAEPPSDEPKPAATVNADEPIGRPAMEPKSDPKEDDKPTEAPLPAKSEKTTEPPEDSDEGGDRKSKQPKAEPKDEDDKSIEKTGKAADDDPEESKKPAGRSNKKKKKPGAKAEPIQIRVLTFNMHHAQLNSGKVDLQEIAQVIRSAKPDIVALQDVDKDVRRTGSIDQPAQLGKLTKLRAVFAGNMPRDGGLYGHAVLSRFPIVRSNNHKLPQVGNSEPRSALILELKLPGGLPPLVFVGTHLDYRRDDQERFECAQAIAALMEKYPDRPAVLAGNFDAYHDSRVLSEFDKSWTRTSEMILPTFPAERPVSQFSYVMVRPAAAWKIIETKTLDDVTFVQHRPILAVLELQPQPEE